MVELTQEATGPAAVDANAGETGHTAAVNGDNRRVSGSKTSEVNHKSKKKNKDEDVVAVEALAEVCLTPDHFDRALAKMQPTVSVESQQAIEGFAQRFHKTSTVVDMRKWDVRDGDAKKLAQWPPAIPKLIFKKLIARHDPPHHLPMLPMRSG
ncbi:hypothetical protein NLG97_g11388 [Lecanicillium saksenae]|uniref:Uncharacterized protein n=1 Tax=Lecanicillium saksenae TaxID=468837 RepID=A0ACC1QBV2_9HYPO|nr:hypothetical protein NLG97_g11388 [Lecanicillium saksenae]